MSVRAIDFSPIADSIRTFGVGLANSALKKAELDRQHQKDMIAFDQAMSTIGLNKSKKEAVDQQLAWQRELAGGYNPDEFSPLEQSAIAANVKAGRNVVADSLRGVNIKQNGIGGGGQEQLNMSTLNGLFSTPELDDKGQPVVDPITGSKRMKFDDARAQSMIRDLTKHGLPLTNKNAYLWFAGVLPFQQTPSVPAVQPSVAPAVAPVQPQQAVHQPQQANTSVMDALKGLFNGLKPDAGTIGTNLPTNPTSPNKVGANNVEATKQMILARYKMGDISYEQAVEMAKAYGIPLN